MAVPDAHGVPYLDVVTLCWLAYKDRKGGEKRSGPPWRSCTGNSWTVTREIEIGPLHAIVAQGLGKTILAFSGTDELADWGDNIAQGLTGISGQYLLSPFIAGSSGCEMVVGHSLGGGLASFVAIHRGIKAATVNPAPLNVFNLFNAINMIRRSSLVINYVVLWEALDILDKISPRMRRVGRIIYVNPKGGSWNPITRHGLDYLAGFTPPTKI
jgi:hypothetical protein